MPSSGGKPHSQLTAARLRGGRALAGRRGGYEREGLAAVPTYRAGRCRMGRDRRVTALGLGRSVKDTAARRQLIKRRCCEASILGNQFDGQS